MSNISRFTMKAVRLAKNAVGGRSKVALRNAGDLASLVADKGYD